jgi:hypothetical protein
MNIPGFTAEVSLSKTDEFYRESRFQRSTESVPPQAITAQFIHRPPVLCDFMICYQNATGHVVCECG